MKREKRELCRPHEAAARLGISLEEVLRMISCGELPAVSFMESEAFSDDDPFSDDNPYMDANRWFVHLADLDGLVQHARRQDTLPNGRAWRRDEFWQLFGRLRDVMF